jgi:hypothetical protein
MAATLIFSLPKLRLPFVNMFAFLGAWNIDFAPAQEILGSADACAVIGFWKEQVL